MGSTYIFIYVSKDAEEREAWEVLHTVFTWLDKPIQREVIDEIYLPNTLRTQSLVVRVDDGCSTEQLASEFSVLLGTLPNGVEMQFVEGADEFQIDMEEVDVQYFRDESKANNGFVVWTDACVRLHHRPSGLVARCKSDRNRLRNLAGATALLKAVLASSQAQRR